MDNNLDKFEFDSEFDVKNTEDVIPEELVAREVSVDQGDDYGDGFDFNEENVAHYSDKENKDFFADKKQQKDKKKIIIITTVAVLAILLMGLIIGLTVCTDRDEVNTEESSVSQQTDNTDESIAQSSKQLGYGTQDTQSTVATTQSTTQAVTKTTEKSTERQTDTTEATVVTTQETTVAPTTTETQPQTQATTEAENETQEVSQEQATE